MNFIKSNFQECSTKKKVEKSTKQFDFFDSQEVQDEKEKIERNNQLSNYQEFQEEKNFSE